MITRVVVALFTLGVLPLLHAVQPVVAIHDSELTRALESMPASGDTPTGSGTTSNQWWTTQWHYFVMPDSVKEALRSDGTAFNVVGDADINAGALLDTNGLPNYPIVISLAAEAISDGEIAQLTNYVAAGGYLLVGSSAFTRNPDGTTRGDFAFANEMGVHMVNANLQNWTNDRTFSKIIEHRLVAHIPGGVLTWQMPASADEVSWPYYGTVGPQLVWTVSAADAIVVAQGDTSPYLLVKPYGKGYFIYDAAMQPLIGHGGYAPGMYAYGIFRKAIEWAFQSAKLPISKLSPWPYPYDAAFMVRHDLENFQNEIAEVAASAQFENANGAKGDYYFCTGTLREEMTNSPAAIAGLRLAVSDYSATIGPHNGGLPNPQNPSLAIRDYDYWHWGPDQAIDVAATNLPLAGYPDGQTYAFTSISNSFSDMEGWLAGLTNSVRVWASPYFNATREASYQIEDQLNVKITGDVKLSPFPSWTLSTVTPDKRYGILQIPVSDWYLQSQVAQSMDEGHTEGTVHDVVDYYYGLGALINLYSHSLSMGSGVVPDYITYTLNTNLHPRVWSANSLSIYSWWLQRSNAQITATFATNGNQSITTLSISGASDPQTTVELLVPSSSVSGLQVLTNGIMASGNSYRTNGSVIKLCVGTSVTNAQVSYLLDPEASNDVYTVGAGQILTVAAPGVLNNDATGAGMNLTAVLVSGPANGALTLNEDGSFSYTPTSSFIGMDSFTYLANDGVTSSLPATVTIDVTPSGNLFFDDFARSTNADPLAPWVVELGRWTITNGVLQGTASGDDDYSWAYAGTNWGDYSVQAEIQLPAGVQAWAGAMSGRVNPLTGENYTANVYPEGSAEGSSVLRLIKFHGWRNWNYTPMALVSLPGVGTNWHALKLTFRGNRINVYYDGIQVVSVTDNNFDGVPAYLTGGIATHMFMDTPFVATFRNVTVSPLSPAPVVADDSYSAVENRTLTVSAPGVLVNDTVGLGTNLIAVLVGGPTNGALTLNTNGGFSYTPNADFVGTDGFTYKANDGVTNSDPATVTITVNTNYPPEAGDDSYSMVRNRTLTVAAPGVLSNDTDANGDSLTAVLLGGAANGLLTLGTDGGFSYTPNTDFVGTDSFTYEASDGVTNSNPATVTITVTTNHPPVANDDNYSVAQNMTLAVVTSGVLGNDTNIDGGGLTAVLVSGAAHGTLNLSTNGGFVYAPMTNFTGTDSFTYEANDGVANSSVATVTITVITNQLPGSWFFDDFTRPTNTTSLAPWVVVMGQWTITNGVLHGTASNIDDYGAAYVGTNWEDYSVQGQIQFPTLFAWGAGLSGRLNPATGERYVAMVCPEQSPLSSGGVPVMQLLKYNGWTTFTRLAQMTLPNVGTSWHTLKLAFCGNQIALYYDGNQVTNLTDNGVFDGLPAYLSGGIGVHMFMDIPFVASYDNVVVWPLVAADNYGVNENMSLSVPAPGVLSNDTAVYGTNLNAVLASGPANGALILSTNGGFVYTPNTNFVGMDSFTYQAYDEQKNLGTATVTIAVVSGTSLLTVTVDSKSRAYGQTNPPLTGTLAMVQGGDNITATYNTSADTNSPVGNYAIVPVFNDPSNRLGNYLVITNGGTLSVTPATLAVNADPQSRLYGVTNPPLTASYSGFQNGDTASVLSGSPALDTVATTNSPVGTYAITIGQGTLGATNYMFSLTNGVLTIGQATLAVNADPQSRLYGVTNPPLTASYSGFQNGDTASVLSGSPALDTVATTNSPVGTYAITISSGTLGATNYVFSLTNGELTVGAATLAVNADPKSRLYGVTNPPLTASYSGFQNGDTASVLSGSPALDAVATTNSPVGTYAITIGQGTLGATNYMFSLTNGVLTIGQATLAVNADPQSRLYGATNPVLTASYSGFLNGDTTSVLTGSPALDTAATTNSPVGTYAITIGAGTLSAPNYMFSLTNGVLTVGQATLAVNADPQSRLYGATNPPLTASYSGFQNGDTASVMSGSPALDTAATTNSPVGTYAITIGQGTLGATNYMFSLTNGVLTIGQATLAVNADPQSRLYGATNPVLTASYSGFLNGDTTSVLTGSPALATVATTNSPVGTYAITIGPGTLSAPNYMFSLTNGELTVGAATLVVNADPQSRLYGVTNPPLTASYSGFLNGDTTSVLSGSPVLDTAATTNSPVGTYAITVAVGTLGATNYVFSLTNGVLTIGQATLAVNADPQSRLYGATNPPLTASYSGFQNGDTASVLSGSPALDTVAITNSPVGTYAITIGPGTLGATNYMFSLTNGVLTIGQATLAVNADPQSRLYGATNPMLTASYSGFQNGDTASVLSGSPALDTVAITNSPVGTYAITVAVGTLGATNYVFSLTNGVLTIGQAMLAVNVDPQSRLYGATNPPLTASYSGFLNGDTTSVLSGSPVLDTVATTNSPVGTYAITIGLGTLGATNYVFSLTNGLLTVGAATLAVNADPQSRLYGATNPVLTASYSGFLNGDTTSVLSGSPVLETVATTNSPVGTYAITVAVGTLGATNYVFSLTNGVLTIGQATLAVNADPQSRLYGATNPVLTASYSGFLNGDTTGVLSGNPALETAATMNSPVGTYAITIGPGTLSATNYMFSLTNGVLAIGQATLAVNADPQSRLYGATNPVLTASYSGFLNGDTTSVLSGSPVLDTVATTNSPVGTYAISVAVGTLGATNYVFILTNGVLTIGQAILDVSADNQSRAYGASNPLLTASYAGFVNGETLATSGITGSPNLATVANAASPAGGYPIKVTDGTLNAANYTFSFVNGTLTVIVVKPTILSLAGAGTTNVVITWSAVSNVTYRVNYQSNFASTNWLNLAPDVTATNTTASAVDKPGDTAPRFYRIQIVP